MRWSATLFGLLAIGFATRASAQDVAAAGALFDRGLADMQAGKFQTACPALDESYRLDPRPGTLFTLAECEAKWGHVASAVTHYSDYVSHYDEMPADQKVRQRERERIAHKQIADLKPRLPMLTVHVTAPLPPGTTVSRDGRELGPASLELPIPIDPGDHVIAVVLASGEKREAKVSIGLGEKKTIEIEPPPIPAHPSEPTAVHGTQETQPPGEATPQASSHVGWTLTAAGFAVVGVALGAITGGMVLGDKGVIEANCNGTVCNQTGLDAASSASTLGIVSDVAFGVGAAAAIAAIVLAATEPRHHARAASVGVAPLAGGGMISWRLSW